MRGCFDSSALIKRVITEVESPALVNVVRDLHAHGAALQTSVLGAVEISDPVITLARRLFPTSIRSLDAIHLASAVLISADLVVAYDRRLLTAASELGLRTLSLGTESGQELGL